MSVVIDGTSGITFPDSSSQSEAAESPSTTYGDVGTYAYGYRNTQAAITPGSTYAGSGIYPAMEFCSYSIPANSFQTSGAYYGTRGSTAFSGTWRAMGGASYASGYPTLLWLRIS